MKWYFGKGAESAALEEAKKRSWRCWRGVPHKNCPRERKNLGVGYFVGIYLYRQDEQPDWYVFKEIK